MNNSLLQPKATVKTCQSDYLPQEIFFCPEESLFYSHCLERMVFNNCDNFTSIAEFGTGNGGPVIDSLLKSQFNGVVNGYESNSEACEAAWFRIKNHNLDRKYIIHNTCFFDGDWQSEETHLIANPPYLPASDSNLYLPALHGGIDGASVTRQLLALNCRSAMLLIPAYSDPVGTIEYAIAQGYQVDDFMTSPMGFGYYSSEPKVKQRIAEMREQQKAFYSDNIYMLAGVLFKKHSKVDLSSELIKSMTAL